MTSGSAQRRITRALIALTCVVVASGCASGTKPDDQPGSTSTSIRATLQSTTASVTNPAITSEVPFPLAGSTDLTYSAGTVSTGCAGTSLRNVENLDPQIFDTVKGIVVSPAKPEAIAGEVDQLASCAVGGTDRAPKVFWVVQSRKPASGLDKETDYTRAYVYDLGNSQPSKVVQIDGVIDGGIDTIEGTDSSLAIVGGGGVSRQFASLSLVDLRVLWTDRSIPTFIGDHMVAFDREAGIEIKTPTGAPILRDSGRVNIKAVPDGDASIGRGAWLVLNRYVSRSSTGEARTELYNTTNRQFAPHDAVPQPHGGSSTAFPVYAAYGTTVFSDSDELQLYDDRSKKTVFHRSAEDAAALKLDKLFYFDSHLYMVQRTSEVNSPFSVIALPSETRVAEGWESRPVTKLSGWTLTYRTEGGAGSDPGPDAPCTSNNRCSVWLVKDVDGRFAGQSQVPATSSPAPTGR